MLACLDCKVEAVCVVPQHKGVVVDFHFYVCI
jgi:hypothetical protein